MKETCLHGRHVAQGAQMAEFAGYDMPIQYAGIEPEHNAVRNTCGVFDVSHMGEIFVEGPEALKFVNRIFTNDVVALADGEVAYGMLTRPTGGVVDDLLVYRYNAKKFLLVVNAANIDKDREWILECHKNAGMDCTVDDASERYAELAIQGPDAEKVLKDVLGLDMSNLVFYHFTELPDGMIVSRTGYTGEDGFEVYANADTIIEVWDKLMKAGVEPCGLGCRDTLRFEVGLPLYGHELNDDMTPVEGSLSMFCKFDKEGGFIGSDVIAAQKAEGAKRRIVGLELHDRAIPRAGYEVLNPEGEVIGHITTGYRGISVPGKSLAMALVDAPWNKKDTEVQVRIRRKVFPATIIPRKFYKKSYKK